MGLLGDLFGGARIKDPVSGNAQVVSTTGYQGDAIYQSCRMQLVVSAEGVPPTAVEHSGLVHNSKWPVPGMTLPVVVDRRDPQRLKIDWDAVEDSGDRAARTAEAMAAAMRGEQPQGAAGGTAGAFGNAQVINLSGGDLSQLSDEQKAKLQMLGIDLGAIAASQGAVPAPAQAGDQSDDRLDQLERLARLRDEGVLSAEEFAEQKRRILEG